MSNYRDNFYSFINKEWLNNNEIPDGYSIWGLFNEIDTENKKKLLSLIESIDDLDDNDNSKIKILYELFLNRKEKVKDARHMVESFLSDIKKITSKKKLNEFICDNFAAFGINSPLMFSVEPDLDNSNMNILHIESAGLGLQDKDYYFDKTHNHILKDYESFMEQYLGLFENFKCDFNNILLIEKKLAECTYSKVEKRNPHLMNNKFDLNIIDCNFKNFYIKDILKKLNLSPKCKINITNPTLIRRYYEMWNCITIKNWINFYSWIYLRNIGKILCKETEESIFNFYSKKLYGIGEMKPDNERALEFVESQIGMVLSKLYVEKYFSDDKRKIMITELVDYIKKTFKTKLENNTWMLKETRLKAIEKLEKMNFKIVCPNEGEWRDYNDLIINKDLSIIDNSLNVLRFETNYEFSQLNKPVDKTEWFMNPHDVNAYYSPNYNEIVFPAGILQGDFFGDDMIKNFGGIGVVIGHEITHGFDDEGCKFDSNGNLNMWFSNIDTKNFSDKSIKLQKQFDNLSIEGLKLDGKLTLGENIADLGGVSISYMAMEEYMKYKTINLTDEDKKKFFKSFAKIWKSKATPESTRMRVTTDPHSPPIYRVNQILGNFKPFLDLYEIKEGNDMYINEEDRAHIW